MIFIHILILWPNACQLFRNFMWNVNHHNTFGLGWTAVNEVHKRIVVLVDDIFFSFLRCIYDIVRLMLNSRFLPIFWWKDFVMLFLHNDFHIRVRWRIPKLILHNIIYVVPRISIMNKGLLIFQIFYMQCNLSLVILFGINIYWWST